MREVPTKVHDPRSFKDQPVLPLLETGVEIMSEWDHTEVSRGTKCFSPMNNGYPGGYPVGYLDWCRENGWWGDKRLHVPCGMVDDTDSIRIDVKADGTNATHVFDARDANLWRVFGSVDNPHTTFNCIMIDPPYTKELAKNLYDTEEFYSGIDSFVNPCLPYLEPGGLLITLSYAVPKRPGNLNLIASWGIYQAVSVSHMRCFNVWQKNGDAGPQGLQRWLD